MAMKFISGTPAAVIGKTLVIADLHLGIELELRRKGIMVATQWKKTAESVNALLKQAKAKELIILGDAKHDVYGFEAREKLMMEDFFSALDTKTITVIRGNHDGGIEQLSGMIALVEAPGFVRKIGKTSYGFAHGHAWPAKQVFEADILLTAHCHPLIEFRDPLGFRWAEKAWVMGETKRDAKRGSRKGQPFVMFPASSKLSGGLAMNALRPSEYMGPLLKNGILDLDNSQAILQNGVRLGKIKKLRKAPPRI